MQTRGLTGLRLPAMTIPIQDERAPSALNIHRKSVGTTAGHAGQGPTPVDAYTLDTCAGLAVTVWTYGATLVEVLFPDRDGRMDNLVVRLPDLDWYQQRAKNPYVGATLGRFARCIAGGCFELDGRSYQLDRNEGLHHFHGGTLGFDRFVWQAETQRGDDQISLHLRLDRPDGDQGYPGALAAEAIYRVDKHRRLMLEYRATTTASTIIGLTNHSFWNLAQSITIDGHQLAVNALRVVMADDDLIPQGPPAWVAGTRLDYTSPRPIGKDRLDHCFLLDDPAWAAILADPVSGRVLRLATDQPALAVYSADHFAAPRVGLCLQTGACPNAPNRADFPSSRLDPGGMYCHRTTYQLALEPARSAWIGVAGACEGW